MEILNISSGNTKLGQIPNISTLPVTCCDKTSRQACKDKCYALKAVRAWSNVRDAWTRNSRILQKDPWRLMQVAEWIHNRSKPVPYFRWWVSGDFFCQELLDAACQVARECPETRFLAFSKAYSLDFSGMPDNMVVIASTWLGLKDTAQDFLPRAYVKFTDKYTALTVKGQGVNADPEDYTVPPDINECPGSCTTCKSCWHMKPGDEVLFHEH